MPEWILYLRLAILTGDLGIYSDETLQFILHL
jgi:hypothetical protein